MNQATIIMQLQDKITILEQRIRNIEDYLTNATKQEGDK